MAFGQVKWFSPSKGYGFIIPESGGADIFLHYSNLDESQPRSLSKGDRVEFEIVDGEKGPKARGVRVVRPSQRTETETEACNTKP